MTLQQATHGTKQIKLNYGNVPLLVFLIYETIILPVFFNSGMGLNSHCQGKTSSEGLWNQNTEIFFRPI